MANASPKHIPSAKANGTSIKDKVLAANTRVSKLFDKGAKAEPIHITPEPAAAIDVADPISFRQLCEDMGFSFVGWKRRLLAYVASFLVGYVIGSTFVAIFNYLFAASILASGWTFITIITAVIGFVASIYLAIKASQKIGGYILSGNIDRDASRAWGWAKGLVGGASNGGLQTV